MFLIFVSQTNKETFIMKSKKRGIISDYLKANRSASRQFELENENGFVSKHSVHKSKKNYDRKRKHKNSEV